MAKKDTKNVSKNAKTKRGSGLKTMYKGREIEPVRYISVENGRQDYMAARYKGTQDELVRDASGIPSYWSKLQKEVVSAG